MGINAVVVLDVIKDDQASNQTYGQLEYLYFGPRVSALKVFAAFASTISNILRVVKTDIDGDNVTIDYEVEDGLITSVQLKLVTFDENSANSDGSYFGMKPENARFNFIND